MNNDSSLDKKNCYKPETKTLITINNTLSLPVIVSILGVVLIIKLIKKNKKQ